MKRCLWLVACAALSGCIQVENTVILKKDGSGSVHLQYSVAEQTAAQVNALLRLQEEIAQADGSAAAPDDDFVKLLFDPDEKAWKQRLARYAANGITVEEFKLTSRGARRHVAMKLKFSSLADVAKADFYPACGVSVTRLADGSYMLQHAPLEKTVPPPDTGDPVTSKLMDSLMGGFNVSLSVKTPSRILRSNAPTRTPDSATWVFDSERDPKAIWTLQNSTLAVLFDGEGIMLPDIMQYPGARPIPGN